MRTGALCEGAWEGFEQAHCSHSQREGFCGAGSTQKALYKARLTPGSGEGEVPWGRRRWQLPGTSRERSGGRSPAGTCGRLWVGVGVSEARERLSAGMKGQTQARRAEQAWEGEARERQGRERLDGLIRPWT